MHRECRRDDQRLNPSASMMMSPGVIANLNFFFECALLLQDPVMTRKNLLFRFDFFFESKKDISKGHSWGPLQLGQRAGARAYTRPGAVSRQAIIL